MLPTNPLLNATAPAGPHLPVALLRQYAAGTLAPAAQHRVEAHTLACPRCNDILEGLLQGSTTTTDQALAQLQQRLAPRPSGRWLVDLATTPPYPLQRASSYVNGCLHAPGLFTASCGPKSPSSPRRSAATSCDHSAPAAAIDAPYPPCYC
jgi:anti-sigma factor RsiW